MFYDKIIAAMGLPFLLIYAAMIFGFLYLLVISIPRTLRTKHWPTTFGLVTGSKLKESQRLTKNGSSITVYSADISYDYTINNSKHASKKIKWVDHRSNNQSHHQEIVNRYALGQRVEVFYNPKNHSVGLLEPGVSTGSFIALAFFVIGLGSMSFLLFTKL